MRLWIMLLAARCRSMFVVRDRVDCILTVSLKELATSGHAEDEVAYA